MIENIDEQLASHWVEININLTGLPQKNNLHPFLSLHPAPHTIYHTLKQQPRKRILNTCHNNNNNNKNNKNKNNKTINTLYSFSLQTLHNASS